MGKMEGDNKGMGVWERRWKVKWKCEGREMVWEETFGMREKKKNGKV